MSVSKRISCLYDGISESDCQLGGCCYDHSTQPSCYYSTEDAMGMLCFV